jgi:S-adenosylmethionine synthetase
MKNPSVSTESVVAAIWDNFDLSQGGIISFLDLKKPIFSKTAKYGHFGRDDVSWEELKSIELFKALV